VVFTHFPLHPETPPEGMLLADLFRGRGYDLEAAHTRLAGLMEQEGLPYSRREKTYNSRLAQELGKWADGRPGGGAIHAALFRAYFVAGRNIGDVDELARIAAAVGLPEDEAREALRGRSHQAAVDADWRRAGEFGITGVPTFVAGGYGLVGAQPYDALEQLVAQARAEREPA
jgi:predicted DsbA family dithiol-disulfide isomerase